MLRNVLICTGLGLWSILVSTRLGLQQHPGRWCTVRVRKCIEMGWLLVFEQDGAIDPDGFREFRNRGCEITVSAQLRFMGNWFLLVHNDLFWRTCPRSTTPGWWSTLSSSISDDRVDYAVFSLSSSLSLSLMFRSVSSSRFIHAIMDISHLQYDTRWQILRWQTFDGKWGFAAFLNVSGLSGCASGFFCE